MLLLTLLLTIAAALQLAEVARRSDPSDHSARRLPVAALLLALLLPVTARLLAALLPPVAALLLALLLPVAARLLAALLLPVTPRLLATLLLAVAAGLLCVSALLLLAVLHGDGGAPRLDRARRQCRPQPRCRRSEDAEREQAQVQHRRGTVGRMEVTPNEAPRTFYSATTQT